METLQKFITKLAHRVNETLNTISSKEPDVIPKATRSVALLTAAITELKEFIHHYKFQSTQEEIHFFKMTKPELVSKLFYFDSMFNLKLDEPFASKDIIIAYYQQEMSKLKDTITANQDFYRYYNSGQTHRDIEYFTRQGNDHRYFDIDQRFSTRYDTTLAVILANHKIKVYIETLIDQLILGDTTKPSPLSWTGSKADFVEIIYALHSAAPLNNNVGTSDIRVIASLLEKAFNFRVGNLYRHYQDIRMRKINPTSFLDPMREKLQRRLEESE